MEGAGGTDRSLPTPFVIAYASIAAILAIALIAILLINSGTFSYPLDDPYIHLALSDHIRAGHYGLNAAESSAPSSSILYPLLLAPFAGSAIHPFVPLLINLICLGASAEILRCYLIRLGYVRTSAGVFVSAIFLFVLLLAFNAVGVALTGLEHSLHIAMVLAVIYGLTLFLDTGAVRWWLVAAIVISPLVRYEGMALSLCAVAVLTIRGQWRPALLALMLILAAVGAFSALLLHLGLAALPSSILSKSEMAAHPIAGEPASLRWVTNALRMSMSWPSALLLPITAWLTARTLRREPALNLSKWSSDGLMSMVFAGTVTAHMLFGQFGWFGRYELYLLFGCVAIGLYLARGRLAPIANAPRNRWLVVLLIGAPLVILGKPLWGKLLRTPAAAHNIYEQQYQMRRFAIDFYRRPIAANDIGWISYGNPSFVLDLLGLGSEKARKLKRDGTAEDYNSLAREYSVRGAVIYEGWFPISSLWVKVGTMRLSGTNISVPGDQVAFYAADADEAGYMRRQLSAFAATVPSGVIVTIL